MAKAALPPLLFCWTVLVVAAVSSSSPGAEFSFQTSRPRITGRRRSHIIRRLQRPGCRSLTSPIFVLSHPCNGQQQQRTTTPTLQATLSSNTDNDKNNPDDTTTATSLQQQQQQQQRQTTGILVLLTVPFAWGSFEPATRFIYALDPPVPPFLFSVAYYAVAAVALVTAATVAATVATTTATTTRQPKSSSSSSSSSDEPSTLKETSASSSLSSSRSRSIHLWPTAGGVELGLYLFVGNALQVLGLKTIPSDRAAFLLQLTTIFVPLLEQVTTFIWRRDGNSNNDNNLMSRKTGISSRMWIACIVALTGVGVMGLEGKEDSLSSLLMPVLQQQDSPTSSLSSSNVVALFSSNYDWNFSTGDALVMAAAVAYSLHCLRLEGFAQTTPPIQLAASKALTETLCSAAAVVALVSYYYYHYSLSPAIIHDVSSSGGSSSNPISLGSFAYDSGEEIVRFLSYFQNDIAQKGFEPWLPALWAVLWTGWITVAYTIYAQSYGQSRVRPTTANLIYTIQPICTAIFAFCLLGETLGPAGYLGGALIGAAVLLVALPTKEETVQQ